MRNRYLWDSVLTSISQYIRWVQDSKIEMIHKSLLSSQDDHSQGKIKEDDYLEMRWEVSSVYSSSNIL